MAFWGREGGGGLPKCLKIFSWKMMGTVAKPKMKNTKKIAKFVSSMGFGRNPPEVTRVSGKKSRV